MFVRTLVFGLVTVFATVFLTGLGQELPASQGIPVVCLGCLCEAASNCNRTLQCSGDVCGLFRITWAYWADAGKPTQPGDQPDSPHAFSNCVNEPFCAARAVQGYMAKFQQDCNGDGRIDCTDYAHIHKLGGYGCRGQIPDYFKNKFDQCMSQVGTAHQ